MIITVLSASLLPSCVKEKDFPVIPVIAFKKFNNYSTDSADCIITFKDGDGDIGIKPEDSSSPNDFKLKYLYLDTLDNKFKPFDSDPINPGMDTLFYTYRVPDLTPEGQYKALDGEIIAKLRAAPIYYPTHKTVKFEITLRDRAGHVSNLVSTDQINLP
jgi:hypothetical protein